MISTEELTQLIQSDLTDAQVEIHDRTGASDHFSIKVISSQFQDLNIMDRHRKVMDILKPAMADGRLHAVELKTDLPN